MAIFTEKGQGTPETESALSIIGSGMRVVGDITADGVVKIEGTVIGTVRAGRQVLVAKGGVDKHQYLEILTSTLFSAPVYKTYGGLIADERFEPPGFAAPLGQKDIRLTLAAADYQRALLACADKRLRLV